MAITLPSAAPCNGLLPGAHPASAPNLKADMSAMPVRFHGSSGNREPLKVLCYGDSLTAGYCNSGASFHPYGRVLAETLGHCSVTVCGLSGRTAEEMLAGQQTSRIVDVVGHMGPGLACLLESETPNVVLILAGTNDLGQSLTNNVSAEAILERVKQLHAVSHRAGIASIAFSPPSLVEGPYRVIQQKLAALIRDWARMEPMVAAHFDIEELVPRAFPSGLWDSDVIHMSMAGQHRLGRSLAHLVPSVLSAHQSTCAVSVSPRSSPRSLVSSPAGTPPSPVPMFVQKTLATPKSGMALIGTRAPRMAHANVQRYDQRCFMRSTNVPIAGARATAVMAQ